MEGRQPFSHLATKRRKKTPHLLVCQLLSEVGHDVPELSRADETVAVLVEHTESFADFLFTEKEENLSIKWPRTLPKDVAPKETISVSIGKRMVLFHNNNIP